MASPSRVLDPAGTLMLDGVRSARSGRRALARIEYLKRNLASEGLFDADRQRACPSSLARSASSAGARALRIDASELRLRGPPPVSDRQVAVQWSAPSPRYRTPCASSTRPRGRRHVTPAERQCRGPAALQQRRAAAGRRHAHPVACHRARRRHPMLASCRPTASTPTDSAKAIVPDAQREHQLVVRPGPRPQDARGGCTTSAALVAASDLCWPTPVLSSVSSGRSNALRAGHAGAPGAAARHRYWVAHLRAQLRTVPQSTLDRGYAIVQRWG